MVNRRFVYLKKSLTTDLTDTTDLITYLYSELGLLISTLFNQLDLFDLWLNTSSLFVVFCVFRGSSLLTLHSKLRIHNLKLERSDPSAQSVVKFSNISLISFSRRGAKSQSFLRSRQFSVGSHQMFSV